ncbi:MAG: S41 family peptidase [Bacteroidota bacterium]
MKKLLIILVFINSMSVSVHSQTQRRFSVKEIKSDLEYLRSTLEASHYNLYAYTKKEVFDSAYNKIESSINDSLTSMQAYRLFQPYLALAKIGECIIFYPFGEYFGNYLRQGGTVFPLNLGFSKGKVFVKDNFSNESQISKGDEILSFNGKPIKEFMEGVYRFMSGQSEYYKNSYLENINFSRIYWFIYDKCDVFHLEIKKKDGSKIKVQLPAISGWEYEGKLSKQYPPRNPAREFRLIDDVAYLYPGEFVNNPGRHDDMMSPTKWDNTEFCHFIDSAFTAFRKAGAKNLIIDLRNNLGGANNFSDYMISYIASKPFTFCSKAKIRTSRITKDFWKNINIPSLEEMKQAILSHDDGSRFEVSLPENQPQPDSIRFTGHVYALINRFSISNTTSVASVIQDYRLGKLIGEETPDFVSFYGGTHQFNLPNTQLAVTYPKGLMIRPNGDTTPRSIIPDYIVEDNMSTDKDEILDYTLETIAKNK